MAGLMAAVASPAANPAASPAAAGRRWPTLVVGALLVWLPLQTPIALLLYQYGGVPVDAVRLLLLAKDVVTAGAIVALALVAGRSIRLRPADLLALGYAAVVVAYAAIPRILGDQLPIAAVVASLREMLVPVELYALGRLAVTAGVDPTWLARLVIVLGVGAAIVGLAILLLPATLLATQLDLVRFVREVQGIPSATDLHRISILAYYGQNAEFARAALPFTHPVGAAHYLVLPLVLCAALLTVPGIARSLSPTVRRAVPIAALVVLVAIIGTISRGAWGAAAIAVAVIGWRSRRLREAAVVIALAAAFVVLVPPYSYAITGFVTGDDESTTSHGAAITTGLDLLRQNPFGMGVGRADFFAEAYSGGAVESGETLYINIALAAGPIALALFVGWLLAIALGGRSWRDWLRRPPVGSWVELAVVAATIGFAASAVTSSPLLRFSTAATFWLLLGAVATRPRPLADQPADEAAGGSAGRRSRRRHGR